MNVTGVAEIVQQYWSMDDMEGEYEFRQQDNDTGYRYDRKSSPHQEIQTTLRNVITPTICALGFLGNSVNIIVLSRLRMLRTEGTKDSGTNLGLIVLAVSDMLFCLSMFPRCFVSESSSMFNQRDFKWFYQMYGTGIVTCFMLTSTWITVVMALMRYVGICHPFSSRKIDGPIFSKVVYSTVFILCILFSIPSFFLFKTIALKSGSEVIYIMDIGLIDQGSTRGQVFIWAKAIIGILIPMALLSFCNCSLIQALRKSSRMRQQYRVPQSSSSNRITLTLIVIMMAFLILVFPSEMMDLVHDHLKKRSDHTEIFMTVRSCANVLQIINFAFNFILYCVINVRFRGMLLQMLPCCHSLFPGVLVRFQRSLQSTTMTRKLSNDLMSQRAPIRRGTGSSKTVETMLNF